MTGRAFIDLHCHTRASFDSLAAPRDVVRAAAARGLTHLAITDHDRVDGALEAREIAPAGLTVIVGEEILTAGGDLIAVFLETAVRPGMSIAETVAAVREQGGLVGIPHPFDRFRNSMARTANLAALAGLVDWIEAYNARLIGGSGNERAAEFAIAHGLSGVAVSDAHSILEVAIAYSAVVGDPSSASGLLAALPSSELVPGHASYVARAMTPVATIIQRARGNGRVRSGAGGTSTDSASARGGR